MNNTQTTPSRSRKRRYFATVPAQEILPIINGDYRSSIKGVYVIGDVTGVPLVKIAANHGVDVIERMVARKVFRPSDKDGRPLDLAIIGAGPAGLSAAMEAQARGLRYLLLERTHLANTIHGFPPGKHVYSEPRYLKNRSRLPVEGDREKGDFLAMVERTVKQADLQIRQGVEVKQIRKRGDGQFEVVASDGESFAARNVVIAVGRQGEARRLGVPGEELSDKVAHRLHTVDDYHHKNVLIVGGGNSAVEAALTLADDNRVTLSYRKDAFFRLKTENRLAVNEAIADGRLEVLFESNVEEIRPEEVVLRLGEERRVLPNDNLLVLIGTVPPVDFLLDAGLELDGVWNAKRVFWCLIGILVGYLVYFQAKHFTLLPSGVDSNVTYLPGFSWVFTLLNSRFANLYSMYYLLYFTAIAGFGLYWAARYKNRIIWRRNLSNIVCNWTLWWGIPTLLVSLLGPNAWTPLLPKLVNAWPLNTAAFDPNPLPGQGDPQWWTAVAVFGVVWAVALTFVILPVFTILVGKHYCSHVCSCGALAETVGNAFRHRGPKGQAPRWLERFGFLFVVLASAVTVLHLFGLKWPLDRYNTMVGTFLAGALAIGVYPFLGQRIWCRYWCPLAFWMNFWGRWSRFKISAEPGRCIDCNICNQYCQMGIDIKSRALMGKPVTLKDSPCVACGECVARCPMEILHFGELPANKPYTDGTDAGPEQTVGVGLHDSMDIPPINEKSLRERARKGRHR